MKIIRHIIRGAGYLEGYGHHPGTSTILLFIFIGGLAGAQRGSWAGFFGGMILSAMFYLPLYIWGCIDRSKDSDRTQKRLLKHIKGD
jgi:hypothetical protein